MLYSFPGVQLSLSPDDTLIIHAPQVHPEPLVTNDIAVFNAEGQFRIAGRKDNTINTGGVKVQIEEVEKELAARLSVPFQITSVPDAKFGEVIVLLTETDNGCPDEVLQEAIHQLPVTGNRVTWYGFRHCHSPKPERQTERQEDSGPPRFFRAVPDVPGNNLHLRFILFNFVKQYNLVYAVSQGGMIHLII